MTGKGKRPPGTAAPRPDDEAARALRQQAEARLQAAASHEVEAVRADASPEAIQQVLHELRVHQIELEMQNVELRRTQLDLDAARARWFDLYNVAPVGYCTVSETGVIGQANLTLASLLGVARGALVRRPFSQFIVAEDQDTYYSVRRQGLADGAPQSCDLRMERVNDQPWWAHLTITAAMDEQGVSELRVVVSDITARIRTEETLRASEARTRSILHSTPDAIITADHRGQVVGWNDGAAALFGRTEAEMLGQSLDVIMPERYRALHRAGLDRVATGGAPHVADRVLELAGLRRDGAEFPLELSLSHWESAEGRCFTSIIRDITGRKRVEAESAALQAQLQQAQKMESIGRLAGGVAHDYNNMLAVILGHVELALVRADASPPLREDLTEIYKAATRSAQITAQLLTFARKQVVQPQVLDINATVAHSLTMLRRLIGEQVQCIWEPAADLWPVSMDQVQIDQILTNLCLNARDAIGGVGTLIVATANRVVDATQCAVLRATAPDAMPGDFVQLTVTDSGCGMSPDILHRIFEPFYTTKDVGKGTGLGLAAVHGAVRQNGGFIAAASVPGEGTTFEIYLPRCTSDVTDLSVPAPAALTMRGDETVLVVEDEPAVRRMTARALARQGYTVLEADSPREAMRLAQERSAAIALLLTDVQMPEMSGYDLVVAMRPAHPYLKHLFMSGYPAGHPVHGREGAPQPEDMGHFIAKPFTLAALTAKVREVLDGE